MVDTGIIRCRTKKKKTPKGKDNVEEPTIIEEPIKVIEELKTKNYTEADIKAKPQKYKSQQIALLLNDIPSTAPGGTEPEIVKDHAKTKKPGKTRPETVLFN